MSWLTATVAHMTLISSLRRLKTATTTYERRRILGTSSRIASPRLVCDASPTFPTTFPLLLRLLPSWTAAGGSASAGRGASSPSGTRAPAKIDAGVFMLLNRLTACGANCWSDAWRAVPDVVDDAAAAAMIFSLLVGLMTPILRGRVGASRRAAAGRCVRRQGLGGDCRTTRSKARLGEAIIKRRRRSRRSRIRARSRDARMMEEQRRIDETKRSSNRPPVLSDE